MPLVHDKLPPRFGKFLRPGELARFQADRFTELDRVLDIKDRFTTAVADVNVDWAVVVAVEEESISILFEKIVGIAQ